MPRSTSVSYNPRVVMLCCEGRCAGLYRIEGLRSKLQEDLGVKELPTQVDMDKTIAKLVGPRKTYVLYREEWKHGMAPKTV